MTAPLKLSRGGGVVYKLGDMTASLIADIKVYSHLVYAGVPVRPLSHGKHDAHCYSFCQILPKGSYNTSAYTLRSERIYNV